MSSPESFAASPKAAAHLVEGALARLSAATRPAREAADGLRESLEGSSQSSAEQAIEKSHAAVQNIDEALALLTQSATDLSQYMAQVLGNGAPGEPLQSSSAPARLRYEGSPKHGRVQQGRVGKAPDDGQAALERSTSISATTTRRVGVDAANDEIVVFDETHEDSGIYHGHVRSWEELSPRQQAALRRAGLTDRRGRIAP